MGGRRHGGLRAVSLRSGSYQLLVHRRQFLGDHGGAKLVLGLGDIRRSASGRPWGSISAPGLMGRNGRVGPWRSLPVSSEKSGGTEPPVMGRGEVMPSWYPEASPEPGGQPGWDAICRRAACQISSNSPEVSCSGSWPSHSETGCSAVIPNLLSYSSRRPEPWACCHSARQAAAIGLRGHLI